MWHVYFLESEKNGRYYIGTTGNVRKRLREHNTGKSFSTKPYRPWKLVRVERYPTLSEARKRERALKTKKSRKVIKLIIDSSPDVSLSESRDPDFRRTERRDSVGQSVRFTSVRSLVRAQVRPPAGSERSEVRILSSPPETIY
ncbi:MAG: GIY-YIG nuclease family protein [Patescibacteria group bacterium]